MVATSRVTLTPAPSPDQDQRVYINGMSWWQYETVLAARGDAPVPRICYHNGTIELMSPSFRHEKTKSIIRMIVEAYCFEKDIYFVPTASTTLKDAPKDRGAEPDESYAFQRGASFPDLGIEIVFTSGSLDKLALYKGLGVREMWFWLEDHLEAFTLVDDEYVRIEESVVIPGLRIALIDEFAGQDDPHAAVVAFRQRIRGA